MWIGQKGKGYLEITKKQLTKTTLVTPIPVEALRLKNKELSSNAQSLLRKGSSY